MSARSRWIHSVCRLFSRSKDRLKHARPSNATPNNTVDPQRLRNSLAVRQSLGEAELAIGQPDHATAEHALARAATLGASADQVAPLSARVALMQAQTYRAMRLIECANPRVPAVRLLTNLIRLSAGQRTRAELDLGQWVAEADCPTEAVTLRAWLWMIEGHTDAAQRLLSRDEMENDPVARQLRLTIKMQTGHAADRRDVTDLLHRFSDEAITDRWADSLTLGQRRQADEVPLDRVELLAVELAAQPLAIRTLVEAQRYRPEADRIALIRRALLRIVDDLPEPLTAIEAIAQLAHLAGDNDDAFRWVQRGLKLAPYSAKLALLLNTIESDRDTNTARGISGRSALEHVAEAQPTWPDVQIALADRYRRDDLPAHAVEHLYRWLMRDPDQPQATAMLKEMAA